MIMAKYCVNKNTENPGGNHEVHKEGCQWWPAVENKEDLGEFTSCHGAVQEAIRRGYNNVDGCATCSPDCHRQ